MTKNKILIFQYLAILIVSIFLFFKHQEFIKLLSLIEDSSCLHFKYQETKAILDFAIYTSVFAFLLKIYLDIKGKSYISLMPFIFIISIPLLIFVFEKYNEIYFKC